MRYRDDAGSVMVPRVKRRGVLREALNKALGMGVGESFVCGERDGKSFMAMVLYYRKLGRLVGLWTSKGIGEGEVRIWRVE